MAKEFILPFSELKGTLNDTPIEPTLEITENGVYNVKGYVYADVNVEGGGGGDSDFSTAEVTMKLPADLSAATLDIQLTDPLTENSNGVVVIEEDNIRYITTDAQTVELAKPSLTEETRVVYLYKNNPVYIKWPLAQSTADYTITGAGEAVGINIDDNTIYAVKVTGNCAIILNAHE